MKHLFSNLRFFRTKITSSLIQVQIIICLFFLTLNLNAQTIPNRDFELGDVQFYTDFLPGCSACSHNSYCVVNNFSQKCNNNPNWPSTFYDHTLQSPDGHFLAIDGCTTANNAIVWRSQNIGQLTPLHTYRIRLFTSNLYNVNIRFRLQMLNSNNSQLISLFQTSTNNLIWQQHTFLWTCPLNFTGNNNRLVLRQRDPGDYFDFGLDDISIEDVTCDCSSLIFEVNQGFSSSFLPVNNFTFTPLGLSNDCNDKVDWTVNGVYIGSTVGNQAIKYTTELDIYKLDVCMTVYRNNPRGGICSSSNCQTFIINLAKKQSSDRSNEPSLTNNLEVWPNPASDLLNIEIPKEIESMNPMMVLYALDGSEIYSQKVKSGINTIVTDQIANGLYLLSIQDKEGHKLLQSKKLLITKD